MKNANAWYIYIVQCADGSLYTGSSTEVSARIVKHNRGQGAKYTRSRLPVQLVYSEQCPNKSAALRREQVIKHFSRKQKLQLISLQM